MTIDRRNAIAVAASIRGIVEIEQAKNDRLESKIQAIGVGLAAGGIAASSGTDKVFQTVQDYKIPVLMHLHPFAFSFLLSCAIALGAAGITWWRTKPKFLRNVIKS
ncbi:hypothetical protein QUB63_29370 [Microcoleus sp. ARI1-B5]|uniref:hypothetical protein n=1 Tax=unclassified Microcoleus TaxID=2642155 RepID=UPI002FD5425E